jgi:ATP-dependent DNA ligase
VDGLYPFLDEIPGLRSGIVSKLKGSRYSSGRTRDWIKAKNPDAPWATRLEDEDWNK